MYGDPECGTANSSPNASPPEPGRQDRIRASDTLRTMAVMEDLHIKMPWVTGWENALCLNISNNLAENKKNQQGL
jgi:hypothetical protein